MNRLAATAIVAALALPGAGAVDPAERLLSDGERALRKDDYRSARRAIDDALELAGRRGDLPREIRARRLLGLLCAARGDQPGAARELQSALERARAGGDRRSEAGALRDLGLEHWLRADNEAARALAGQALAIQTALGDESGEGASVDLLARIDLKTGRTDDAVARFEHACVLRARTGGHWGEVDSRLGLVLAHLERRDFRRAMSEIDAVRRLGRDQGDRDVEIEALAQSAIAWMFQGAADAALEALDEARALASRPPDPALLARVTHLQANALRTKGDHAAAVEAHDEAIRAYELLGNEREVAWNLARRSRSELGMGDTPRAEASLRQALEIWRGLSDRRAAAHWTYEYGKILQRMGRNDEAWGTWDDALARQAEIRLPYAALVLAEMAGMEAERGAMDAARLRASAAVDAAEDSGTPQLVWIALYRRALIERRSSLRDAALRDLLRSLDVIEAMRLRVVPADEALVGFLEDKQEVFAEAVDLLMELGRAHDALEVAERARARALLELLKDRPDPLASASGGGAPLAGLGDATVVEFHVGRARTFAWVVDARGRLRVATIPVGAAALAAAVGTLRRDIGVEDQRATGESRGEGDVRTALRRLHRELWEPILRFLPADPDDRITIVPHGPLFVLPFGSLIGPDDRYVIERHTLDYAPSLRVLAAIAASEERETEDVEGCLVVANPSLGRGDAARPPSELPGAEAEAAAVAFALHGGANDVLLGADATEIAVRALAPHRAVIHFATHGLLRDDDPLASALLLTPSLGEGPAGDGSLSAREILDLPLRARLVTLAACDSGLGRVTGEGMLGFGRSFLHAGARSVVVSLWRVSDLVGGFEMGRFYAELGAGRDRAVALRHAQLDTLAALRRGTFKTSAGRRLDESPGLWAPFVLLGDGRGGSPR